MLTKVVRLCGLYATLALIVTAVLPLAACAQGRVAANESGARFPFFNGLATVALDQVESRSDEDGTSAIAGRVSGPNGIDLYCRFQLMRGRQGGAAEAIAAFTDVSSTLRSSPVNLPVLHSRSGDRSDTKVLVRYAEWWQETGAEQFNIYRGEQSVFVSKGKMYTISKDCFLTRDLAKQAPRSQVSELFDGLWDRAQIQYAGERFQVLR